VPATDAPPSPEPSIVAATDAPPSPEPSIVAAPATAAATEPPPAFGTLLATQYEGIPQGVTPDGFPFLGQPDAPLTLIDYSDFL
jgi:hypothetical protein